MKNRLFLLCGMIFLLLTLMKGMGFSDEPRNEGTPDQGIFRIGIIGTTTSHVPAALQEINSPDKAEMFQNCRITAVYVGGMPGNPDSWGRRETFATVCQENGLDFYQTIDEMLPNVDGVILFSVDGRCHLEQAKPVIAAGKPLYIDKPAAGSLADVLEIYRLAEEKKVPIFSSSSLRFTEGFQKARNEKPLGEILGAEGVSPCSIHDKEPDLYHYGIHGVETLFTLMGKGCVQVSRTQTEDYELAVGTWEDGRIGVFRGMRKGGQYAGFIFGEKGNQKCGEYDGYNGLFLEICRFFRTGISPVDPEETINLYAFMSAADVSKDRNGATVSLAEVLEKARNQKEVTVTLTLDADGNVKWNGEPVEMEEISRKVDEAREDGSVVRIILDNRAGADFALVEKILPEIDNAYFANYLYHSEF